MKRHIQFICTCWREGCMFCDGGLFACTVCGGFEGSLTTHCPGTRVDEFTSRKVYETTLDFVNGQWTRDVVPLWLLMRGQTVDECRRLYKEMMAAPSMDREKIIRGW